MWFKWKDINVNYKIIGEGQPILMIHGFTPDHELMLGCMEPLFENSKSYKRIYLDLPGMGLTEHGEHVNNADDMLEVVMAFIETVIGHEPFLVAGESYGGYLTRGLVHKMPERIRGALFICPLIKPILDHKTLPKKEVLLENSDLLNRLSEIEREMYEGIAVVQEERTWQHFKTYVLPGLLRADKAFLERYYAEGYGFSFDEALASDHFNKPALFLTGRQDTSVGYKDAWQIMDQYPRGTYAVLDRAGHSLEAEQSVLFNALVNEWLFRCEENTDKK